MHCREEFSVSESFRAAVFHLFLMLLLGSLLGPVGANAGVLPATSALVWHDLRTAPWSGLTLTLLFPLLVFLLGLFSRPKLLYPLFLGKGFFVSCFLVLAGRVSADRFALLRGVFLRTVIPLPIAVFTAAFWLASQAERRPRDYLALAFGNLCFAGLSLALQWLLGSSI